MTDAADDGWVSAWDSGFVSDCAGVSHKVTVDKGYGSGRVHCMPHGKQSVCNFIEMWTPLFCRVETP